MESVAIGRGGALERLDEAHDALALRRHRHLDRGGRGVVRGSVRARRSPDEPLHPSGDGHPAGRADPRGLTSASVRPAPSSSSPRHGAGTSRRCYPRLEEACPPGGRSGPERAPSSRSPLPRPTSRAPPSSRTSSRPTPSATRTTFAGRSARSTGRALSVTGQAAIETDLEPIQEEDLQRGEFLIAIPIAFVILVAGLRHARVPDPVRLRDRRDPGDARSRLDLREHDGALDVRHPARLADRARNRHRLLAADGVPLPGGTPRREGEGRGGRGHDADRRPGRRLQRDRRRDRAGAAPVHAAAVHARLRRSRV